MATQSVQARLDPVEFMQYLDLLNYKQKKDEKKLNSKDILIWLITDKHEELRTKGEV